MKKFPGVSVLETQFNDNDTNKAASQFAAVLARNADLAGVFGTNLFSAQGAANGVKNAGKKGAVKVVAFDAPESMVGDIKSGTIDIAIAQHPAEMGQKAVEFAVAALNGKKVPTRYGTGYTVMNKGNIDDPKVKAFLYSTK